MKLSIMAVIFCICPSVFADSFHVVNPKEQIVNVFIPMQNVTCIKGPFHMYRLKVVLPQRIGSPEQRGVLQSEFLSSGEQDCEVKLKDLAKLVNGNGELELKARIVNRSVVKLSEKNARTCEGAQQEIIAMDVGTEDTVSGSIYVSYGELTCPEGLDSNRVYSRDLVLYVLHEDGIPTGNSFMKGSF
jgi:hypothetical protein